MTVNIYALIDPRTSRIRYIGKAKNLSARLRSHVSAAANNAVTHKYCWIRSLLKSGLRPEIKIVETCSEENWKDKERFWIAHFLNEGADLANHTKGGDGVEGFRLSKSTIASIAAKNRGRLVTKEHRLNISKGLKLAWKTKPALWNRKPHLMPDSFKKAMSIKMRGNKNGKGNRSNQGTKWSDEHREKTRLARMKFDTPEYRAKLRASAIADWNRRRSVRHD